MNKSVNYLGLDLRNPIIVSSCGFTSNIDGIKSLEGAGAAAVVLKSLFEEQINAEVLKMSQEDSQYGMEDYIANYVRENSVKKYLELISTAKKECSIPIIASICCSRDGQWVSFAKEIERAGADALELNVFYMPLDADKSSSEIEQEYLRTVEHVVKSISIPVSVKIPDHFTSPLNMVKELYFRGVKGVVMFNKFYEPDIDTKSVAVTSSPVYSSAEDIKHPLRWIAISSSINKAICHSSSTGVHSGDDVVKMLLAGAKTVGVCSALYEQGVGVITKMLEELEQWCQTNTYDNINDMIGALNYSRGDSELFERSQFMKYYSNHSK